MCTGLFERNVMRGSGADMSAFKGHLEHVCGGLYSHATHVHRLCKVLDNQACCLNADSAWATEPGNTNSWSD